MSDDVPDFIRELVAREDALTSPAVLSNEPVHHWFGLSYASYLVLPRLALQEMPVQWQRRLVALLEEGESLGMTTPCDYQVIRRSTRGRFRGDPWADYRHGTAEGARAADVAAKEPTS